MKTVYIDGSGWNGRRSACCAYHIDTGLKQLEIYEEKHTNNEMEYQALINVLKDIVDGYNYLGEEVNIITDSQLLERQLSGKYEVKADNLKLLYNFAKSLMKLQHLQVHVQWVPRDKNKAGIFLEQTLKKI